MERVVKYLNGKRKFLEEIEKKEESSLSKEMKERVELELKNAMRALREWYSLRERKIVTQALIAARAKGEILDKSRLLMNERELFEDVVNILREHREKFENSLREEVEEEEKKELDKKLVRINEKIEKFVWGDGNIYGPFEEGEVVNLPKEIANYLIENDKAVEVGVEE
ncbi:MAG TPA: hypothetical protein ENG56_01165 [Candidatus Aenigmarchaeota archaeon]|nr:hypothetical protein [Candidatus Aenigmarchaeota archaeon]